MSRRRRRRKRNVALEKKRGGIRVARCGLGGGGFLQKKRGGGGWRVAICKTLPPLSVTFESRSSGPDHSLHM
jgi:hypothetical protein